MLRLSSLTDYLTFNSKYTLTRERKYYLAKQDERSPTTVDASFPLGVLR